MQIEYNRAVEFVGAMYRYSTNKMRQEILKSADHPEDSVDFAPSPEVKDWLETVDSEISPFLKNDLLLVLTKMRGLLDSCFTLVVSRDLQEPHELIALIAEMEATALLELIFSDMELGIPFDSSEEVLTGVLSAESNDEFALYFLQAKKHPEEYRSRVLSAFRSFYEDFVQPDEKTVQDFMEPVLAKHNQLFLEDQADFLNSIGIGDYSKLLRAGTELRIFVSYYIDLGVFHFYSERHFIMLYGHTIKQPIEEKISLDRTRAIFKALSDDTRLQIIRITSRRPWYNKELAEHFKLTSATLSYHLNLLLDLEILNFEPSVNNRYYYTTNRKNLEKLLGMALQSLMEE